MTFFNRNGMLYARINGQRVSTKLQDTKVNRKLFLSYAKNNEFLEKFNVNKNAPTVLKLCEEVLEDKETTLKATSYNTYLSLYTNNIVPYFNKKKVTEIKPKDIKDWYKTFKDRSTVIICEAILKPAFENAILAEYIDTTPMIISKPKYTKTSYEANPFTHTELQKILNHEDSFMINFIAISSFTGMRTGELFGLRWKDVDLVNNKIDINQQITKGKIQTPKTESSRAVIDLTIEAKPFFEKQRLKTGLREYLFYAPRGETFKHTAYVNILLKEILAKLDISPRSIYQTRHTFASIRLSLGEKVEWVSFMLRHKDVSITLKRYFKYIKELDTKRVDLNFDLSQKQHSS